MPQHRFASIHIVGTNGKSSVTEMTAARVGRVRGPGTRAAQFGDAERLTHHSGESAGAASIRSATSARETLRPAPRSTAVR